MAYIYPAPGVAGVETVLTISVSSNGADTGMVVPALQDMTINAANDVFTWTQLDETAKLQIATTSTNSISMNIVLDQATFFGTGDGADAGSTINRADEYGIFGLSTEKVKIDFDLYLGDTDGGAAGKTISGTGYVTGLAPTVSADSPVWVTPITITVTGEYTVA
jgi:hypothetical protein